MYADARLMVWRTGIRLPKDFGDVLTADHKVLEEDLESVLRHRHAVVVQD